MKPRINEVVVNYVQCPKCDYEKSYLLSEQLTSNKFFWCCPRCAQLWQGRRDADGTLEINESRQNDSRRAIVVEFGSEYSPWVLNAIREQKVGEPSQGPLFDNTRRTTICDLLVLSPATSDPENNPRGLPHYRADVF